MSNRAFDKELGHRIQSLRREKGYSSAKVFMERTGITRFSQATYAAIEQGSVSLSVEKAIIIADKLGITLDELAGLETAETPEAAENEAPEVEPAPKAQPEETSAVDPASRDERDLLRDYRELSAVDRATVARMVQALTSLGREEDAVRAQVLERLYGSDGSIAEE